MPFTNQDPLTSYARYYDNIIFASPIKNSTKDDFARVHTLLETSLLGKNENFATRLTKVLFPNPVNKIFERIPSRIEREKFIRNYRKKSRKKNSQLSMISKKALT